MMGFFENYIIIFVLGLVSHKLNQIMRNKGHKGFMFYYSLGVVFGAIITDLLLLGGVFNSILTAIPWTAIDNGKDFLWNPFLLFGYDANIPYNEPGLNWISITLILNYISCYIFGKTISLYIFGMRSYPGGLWWTLKPLKKPNDKAKSEL